MAGSVPDIRIRIIVDNTGATATVTETKAAITDLTKAVEQATPALTDTAKALEVVSETAAETAVALETVGEATAATVVGTEAVGVAAEASSTRLRDMVKASLELQAAQKSAGLTTEEFNAKQALNAEGAAAATAAGIRSQEQLQRASTLVRQSTADEATYAAVLKGRITSIEGVGTAEQSLDRLVAAGTITQTQHIAALEALTVAEAKLVGGSRGAATALSEVAPAAKKVEEASGLANLAVKELGVVGGEFAAGNFGRLRGSLISFANRAGLLSTVLSPVGLALAGLVGTLGLLAVAFVEGAKEDNAFNRALISTGDYSGLTVQGLHAMAEQLVTTTGTIGQAKEALLALTASGKFTGDQLLASTKIAEDFGRLTGLSVEKAAAEIIKLKDAPLASIKKLDEEYHFLTLAQYAQIEALDKAGEKEAAFEVIQKALGVSTAGRVAMLDENLNTLGRAWDNVRKNASLAWDSMLHTGAKVTNESELADVSKQLDAYRARVQEIRKRRGDNALVTDDQLATAPEIVNSRDDVQKLLAKKKGDAAGALFEQQLAATAGHNAQLQQQQKENHDILMKTEAEGKKDTEGSIARMNAEIAAIEKVRASQHAISPNTAAADDADADSAIQAIHSKYDKKAPKGPKGISDNTKELAQESIESKIEGLNAAGEKLDAQVDNVSDQIANKIDARQDTLNKALVAGEKQIKDSLREKKITDAQATADTTDLTDAYTKASVAVTAYGNALRATAAATAAQKQAVANQKTETFLDQFQRRAQPQNKERQLADELKLAEDEFDKLTEKMDKNSEAYQLYLTRFKETSQELTDNAKKNGDDIGQFALEAAKNIQDQLGKGLTDTLNGSFKQIPANFAKMLQQMMVQLVSSEIGTYLFGEFDKTGKLEGVGGGLLNRLAGMILGKPSTDASVAPTALNSAAGLLGNSPFNNVATGAPGTNYGVLGAGNATGQQGQSGALPLTGLLNIGSSLLGLGGQKPGGVGSGAGSANDGSKDLTSAAGLLTAGAKSLGLGSTTLGTNSGALGTSTGLFSSVTTVFGTTTDSTLVTAGGSLTTAATALGAAAVSLQAAAATSGGGGGSGGSSSGFLGLFAAGMKAYAGSGGGYATGGYTGAGGKYEAAGVVHAGEFVMTAENTARYRPLLEAMHSGNLGKPHKAKSSYATGGLVQSIATTAPMQAGGQKQTIINAITHDFVHQAMASAAGEKVTMNHITNNSRQVGQVVGGHR